MTDNSPNII